MRIYYFPKFITYENSKEYSLENCSLVIDGQNFFYDSYEQSKLTYAFGSEANEHAKYLRKMLNMFKETNVKCYIVFKGGDADIDKKVKRCEVYNYDIEENPKFVPPVFLKEVCKQVLEESGVNYTTCVMESKDDCAALAHTLGCSVMSNDIEFCFRPVPYILSKTIKYRQGQKNIMCRQFNLDYFLKKHGLTNKKLAMFAALADVNVFPEHHFNDMLKPFHILNQNLYVQNKSLLQWLAGQSEDETQSKVLDFLTEDVEKKLFLDRIQTILKSMVNRQGGVVTDYLYNNRKLSVSRTDPFWFEKGVATQNIAIHYINLYNHKHIRGSWVIEEKNSTDSLMLSIDIIKYAYNLLTNFQTSVICVYNHSETSIKVNTKDPKVKKPVYQCRESVFENGWEGLKRLKLFEHFLSENDINTEVINKFPMEGRMLLIALTYFARKKAAENIDVTKEVFCVIISYVMLHYVFDKDNSLRKKNSGINKTDSAEAIKVTNKYFRTKRNEAKQIFDGVKLKTLVELQYCLVHMNYLNALCGTSFMVTKYHRTFNGTFVYKLLLDMTDADNNEFIEGLFQTAPSVLRFINSLINTYKELF